MSTKSGTTYIIAIAGSAASLSVGYILINLWWVAPIVLAGYAVWLWGNRGGWRRIDSAAFVLTLLATAAGLLLSLAPALAIVSVVLSLVAWDVSRLVRSLGQVDWVFNEEIILRRYRRRMVIVSLVGALIAALAMVMRVNFGFGIALLLGLASVLGFSRAMIYLRREGN